MTTKPSEEPAFGTLQEALGEALKTPLPEGLPVVTLHVPEARSGDYLATLHQWGELPEVASVEEVARLLAALCKQNPAAIKTVLKNAINNLEIKFWGRSASHQNAEWVEDMVRVLHSASVVSKRMQGEDFVYTLAWGPDGELHIDAMGVRPRDAVALLVARGRKVPPELREFLPESPPAPASEPIGASAPAVAVPEPVARPLQRQRHQEAEILRVLRELGHDPHALPRNTPGRAGPKAAAFGRLGWKKGERGVFDKAWDRLRQARDIADA